MNDLHHPCELWAEPLSLAAAGCLSPDEERDVRRHIETCSACRERFEQLTRLCGVLAESRLPADSAERAVVERLMAAVASDQSASPVVRSRVEILHPALLTRFLDTWRWIMRSPIVLVLALTGRLVKRPSAFCGVMRQEFTSRRQRPGCDECSV